MGLKRLNSSFDPRIESSLWGFKSSKPQALDLGKGGGSDPLTTLSFIFIFWSWSPQSLCGSPPEAAADMLEALEGHHSGTIESIDNIKERSIIFLLSLE
jgi:hypothetical protein